MRNLITAPLLALSLAGCAQPQYLLTERTDPAPAATTSSLRDVPSRYTNHPAFAGKTEVIPFQLKGFSALEQAKIEAAVGEWNHVLNGAVRFDVPSTNQPSQAAGAWTAIAAPEEVMPNRKKNPEPLAVVVRLSKGGGYIIVYTNRIEDPDATPKGGYDLRGVMVHELGVALGGGNDPALYTAHVQDCIDKNMAATVATVRELPPASLNWCVPGANVASAAR